MQDYLIERDIPGIGRFDPGELRRASATSNAALARVGAGIEWVSSFVTGDKTFCHYRAESEELIREHARTSGIPASVITPVVGMINPATGRE